MDTTTIEVRVDQAEDLHDMKRRGESYKDVLDRLIEDYQEEGAGDDVEHVADQDDRREDRQPDEPEPDADPVNSLDLPGQGSIAEDRREAVRAVLHTLDNSSEPVRASVLRDTVYDDHPAGYETPRSWWKNMVSPALSDLADRDRVELVNKHNGEWASRES